jgi:hypothetical protein
MVRGHKGKILTAEITEGTEGDVRRKTADGGRQTADGRANTSAVVVRRWSVVERRKNIHHRGTEDTKRKRCKA